MRAFLFPGQGAQFAGMGRDAFTTSGIIRDIFNRANDVLERDLTGVMFEGPEEELRQTRNAQPAIFLHSYALYQLLRNPHPAMAAGHSLGEYTALTVANALTFDDALRLVQLRAHAMQDAGTTAAGTMAAIIGMEDEAIAAICRAVGEEIGVVQPANFNSPGQVVVSGTPEAVAEVMTRAKSGGARMAKQLNVSGAFHSPLMEPARVTLAEALERAPMRDAEFPVYANVTAAPLTHAEDIRASLLQQLTAPVLWTGTIQRMAADGATEFIEVGPGNVLQGLAKRIAAETAQYGVAEIAGVEAFNAR
ncbi:MAG: ACP S-malonyltransferase [Candidatus Kapaibacterium sp.]